MILCSNCYECTNHNNRSASKLCTEISFKCKQQTDVQPTRIKQNYWNSNINRMTYTTMKNTSPPTTCYSVKYALLISTRHSWYKSTTGHEIAGNLTVTVSTEPIWKTNFRWPIFIVWWMMTCKLVWTFLR